MISSLLGSCRFVYNQCLTLSDESYKESKKTLSRSDCYTYFRTDLKDNYSWLNQHNSKVIAQSINDLDSAFKNFFKHKYGRPSLKKKKGEQKCRFPIDAISKKPFDEVSSRLNLTTTINGLKFKCSDRDKKYLFKNKNLIKSVTLIKSPACNYYASILIDGDLLKTLDNPINNSVGIDLGIKTLLTLSNGESIENPKWFRTSESKIKRLQKRLSKKKKGSNNRKKAKLKLAKAYEKIKNRKQNYLHNISNKIVNENQIICLEDLNVKGMLKNHKLSKAIQELGLYELKRQLEYKSNWYGRDLVLVSRWYPSSKTCSCCGWKNDKLKLSDREFKCEDCGNVIDRDYNASINIQNEGLRLYKEKNRQV